MSNTVEQIKDRLSIQDVVGSYIKLERAGKNLKAACPFHNEKTPSFFVSPERDSYYCFGCGAKGDIFTFVEEFEGLDFRGALKVLAERAGVQITYSAGKDDGATQRMFDVVEAAAVFFEHNRTSAPAVGAYLAERGIEEKTALGFRLGYAPDEWRLLRDHLAEKKWSDHELLTAGLIKRKEGGTGHYDTFRGRIMFPITDSSGRVIAFSGRVFPPVSDEEAVGERSAKYVNSPETPLFHKSRVLYGFDKAKSAMRKYDFCILVEGQTDVIMSHQAGFHNTVAPLGTAITREHLASIKRFTENIVLALDADPAGLASAGRGAELALALGFDVKVARLPGKDPADVIKEDPDLWRKAVRESMHIVEVLLKSVREVSRDEREYKQRVGQTVLPYIARIENKIDQAHFVKIVAETLGVGEGPVQEEVQKLEQRAGKESQEAAPTPPGRKAKGSDRLRELLGLILAEQAREAPEIDVQETTARLAELMRGETLESLMARYEKDEIAFEAEREAERTDRPAAKARELLTLIELDRLKEERKNIQQDDMKTFQELSHKIDALERSMRANA